MDDVAASLQSDEASAPRSACSSCHRRKLKCDRVAAGCANCKKSNIPCIYTNETARRQDSAVDKASRRRPRGPYQKGKTPREKELEHVVELLHSKCEGLQDQLSALQLADANATSSQNAHPALGSVSARAEAELTRLPDTTDRAWHQSGAALTGSDQLSPHHSIYTGSSPGSFSAATGSTHPTSAQILQMWLIFQATIDPLTKLVHVPTMTEKIFAFKDDTSSATSSFEFLMFTVYLSVVNTLSPEKVLAMLRQSKDKVLANYQAFLDQAFAVVSLCNSPDLMMLQALLLFLSATRRKKQFAAASGPVFGLSVRIAQLLGVDRDEYPADTPPIEVELRRRCWWMLCRFESSLSEELPHRKLSIMYWSDIPIPGNYNDTDFAPGVMEHPEQRRGITDMSLTMVIHEVIRLNGTINRVLRQDKQAGNMTGLPQKLKNVIQECRHRIEDNILAYCDTSRPLDWLLMLTGKVLLTKVEILALEPPTMEGSNSDLITAFLDRKVSLSLDVIECHQLMTLEAKLEQWRWAFETAQQSYAVAYVLDDLTRRPRSSQADRGWCIIEMLFCPQGSLGENGSHPEAREALIDTYNKAVQVRAAYQAGMPSQPVVLPPLDDAFDGQQSALQLQQDSAVSDTGAMQIATGRHALNALQSYVNNDPWHLEGTLLDIEGAGVNVDAFFWPSGED